MGAMVRVIATDLDGTLLDGEGRVSARNRAALKRARQSGIKVVVATARSHFTARPIVDGVEAVDRAVCSNGATIFEPADWSALHQHAMAAEDLADMCESVAAGLPGCSFGWETSDVLVWEQEFAEQHPRDGARIGGRPEVPVNKVLIAHREVAGHELLELLRPLLKDGLNPSNSGAEFVEVTARGVDKGFGLGVVCEAWGIRAEEVVAFGDQVNDIPMLEWAGTGVAVANAHPAALEAADMTAPPHGDDGVARIVEGLI
jgi:Cof subfamily protein (haloacid dehalogenase superfamily)